MDNPETNPFDNNPQSAGEPEEHSAAPAEPGAESHDVQQVAPESHNVPAPEHDHQPAPKRNPAALFFVAAIVATLLFVGFHAARKNVGAGGPPDIADPAGKPAPEFTLATLDGKNVSLSDFRGQAVLLNFWATWCGPCKVEMPWFVELQKEYGPQGLQIVGVAMDDASAEDIQKFVKEMGVNYTILMGKESVGQQYGGVDVLPTTFFIDRDGKVVSREFGLQSRSLFVDNIKKALSQGHAVQAQK
jgi:cytochrome c biogenesis protein CcmG/thiol:disulfide interchange protein DsbE